MPKTWVRFITQQLRHAKNLVKVQEQRWHQETDFHLDDDNHYETKTHENLVKLFMVNSQIFHSIFMVKLMAFSWSQCHEKDMKNPMKTLWKFPYSRPMKHCVRWPRSHEIPMKMAFHGLFTDTEKPLNFMSKFSWCKNSPVFNGLQQIMTH